MSDTTISLRRKINSAGDLQSVVRTMKAVAASSIGQYEKSVTALNDYSRTVDLGLHVCLRAGIKTPLLQNREIKTGVVLAVVFGSDQGLVGQFNDLVADLAIENLTKLPQTPQVWAVGERVHQRLVEAGLKVNGIYDVPASVNAITPLVGQILVEYEKRQSEEVNKSNELYLFYNALQSGHGYAPQSLRLLPLDQSWSNKLSSLDWPGKNLPEVFGNCISTLKALIREYLFVSLFRACADSLVSENTSRLAAMQRAEKNIDDLLEQLNGAFHRLRQSKIDEELFDVLAGFDELRSKDKS